jgi:tripartite-type tricarboxylate transporter receptor subunit TctC
VKILARDDIRKTFLKQGMEAEGNTPQAFTAAIIREVEQWKTLVKAAGIKVQ